MKIEFSKTPGKQPRFPFNYRVSYAVLFAISFAASGLLLSDRPWYESVLYGVTSGATAFAAMLLIDHYRTKK